VPGSIDFNVLLLKVGRPEFPGVAALGHALVLGTAACFAATGQPSREDDLRTAESTIPHVRTDL